MAILNEKNDFTKGTIHLMITDKCNRRCPDCCNNQYNISDIPVATSKDFIEAKHVYLTGGEPFAYGDPCLIAERLKMYYPNIEKIIARKDQKGFCIEYIINGKQSDSFYSNLTKNQIYIFLETLNRLLYKNVTITGCQDIEDHKTSNTDLIINLINLWNQSNV